MSKLKHSQGNWETSKECINSIEIIDEYSNVIACVIAENDDALSEEEGANAQLIAAAPELLDDKIKDFKELGPWLSAALDDPKACKELKDVIKKWFKRFDTFEKATGFKIEELED